MEEYYNYLDNGTRYRISAGRYIFDLNDMMTYIPDRVIALCGDFAMEEQVQLLNALMTHTHHKNVLIGFEGTVVRKHTPREILTYHHNRFIKVEGIVSCQDFPQCQLVKCVEYNGKEKRIQHFFNHLSLYDGYTVGRYKNDNNWEEQYGLNEYHSVQTITLSDVPNYTSEMRSIQVILINELTNMCKPGDKLIVYGNYKHIPRNNDIEAKLALVATNISLEDEANSVDSNDIRIIRKLSLTKNIMDILAHALAPTVIGNDLIKKAIICLLVGGTERRLNPTRLRGNINILLIGDPATAKSQLLQSAMNVAKKSVFTSGSGASGVGLTAAVIISKNGEKHIEAGVMVLGDKGVVCIDEFDKMKNDDRRALHECLEQCTVTITKAGLNITLNSRCSVLAAANPPGLGGTEIEDALLSRFDLIFRIKDVVDPQKDVDIATSILTNHASAVSGVFTQSSTPRVTLKQLSTYIQIAYRIEPKMPDELAPKLAETYAKFRQTDKICPRTMDSLHRLATASAKARLSKLICIEDIDFVIELYKNADKKFRK